MKLREKTTATLLIAIFMISAFAVAIPVMSMEPCDSYETAIIAAADRLVQTQQVDGGWRWPGPSDPPELISPYNTVGVTAQGILDAYRLESKQSYLDACILAYQRIELFSHESLFKKNRIRGPDITFLVELSEVTGESTYADFAKERYAVLLAEVGGTATEWAEYVRVGRAPYPGLISWDINFYIQGVLALERYYPDQGYFDDAVAMAEVIYDALYVDPVDYDITNSGLEDYGLAVSGALEAFVTTGIHETEAEALETILIGLPPIYYQTPAYTVMALLKTDNLVEAIALGDYFVLNQLPDGSWPSSTGENSEVNSEVAQALYDLLCMRKVNFVPGKGKGLDKIIPNDNFAKGRRKE